MASELDRAIEEIDRRIEILTRAKDALREAAPIVAECGCGRPRGHRGRCWFVRGYASAGESRRLPHQHKERRRVDKAFEDAQRAVAPYVEKELAGENITQEILDTRLKGEEMVTVSDLIEEVLPGPELANAVEEQAKPRIEELKRIGREREQDNIRKHNEVKEFQMRARGICPKCRGPMGRSPYAACSSCMGPASRKAEAAAYSKPPSNLSGNGGLNGGNIPSL